MESAIPDTERWTQLQRWYESCSSPTVTELPSAEDQLNLARNWIQQHLPCDSKRLDYILKWLLNLPVLDDKDYILRQIEWQVVLLLELRCAAQSLLLERFTKCQRRMIRSKRKCSETISPDHRFLNFLIEQLTRAAFALAPNEPLATYLFQKILTRYTWQKLPAVVTDILDFLEIENPYLNSRIDTSEEMHVRKKSKRSQRPLPAPPVTAPSRRPLVTKTNNFPRLNHFHGMLTDMEKLLDESEPVAPAELRHTQKRSIITPQSSAIDKAAKPVNNCKNRFINKSIIKKAAKSKSDQPTPITTPRSSQESRDNQSNRILLSPRPCRHQPIVAETPLSSTRRRAAETPVSMGQTPLSPTTSDPVDESPRDRFASDASDIKPIKLFAAVSNRPVPFSMPTLPPADEEKGHKKRSTSLAVAAARSFLKRKSL